MTCSSQYEVPPAAFYHVLRTDFYAFVQAMFPTVAAGAVLLRNWHLEAMSYALTLVMQGEIKRLIIAVPPRHLKSICSSVALPAYILGHNPTRRIICVSYSEALARKHANDCRAVMRSNLYRRVFPRTRISSDKDTELEFMTTERGSRLATSVGGTLTGRGGNLVIIDDPLKPQDAYSEASREHLNHWYANTLLSRLDNKANDPIVVVMQRLHPDDLVGHLLEQRNWTILNLPAIAEEEQLIPLGPGRVFRRLPGNILHPERESREVLMEIRQAMGSLDFAAQYQQQPVPPTGVMVNWSWFSSYDTCPEYRRGDRIILSWDTAQSVSELADYTACVVLQIRREAVYVLDVVRERLDYPSLRRKALSTYHQWRRTGLNCSIVIENKGSGMSLVQDLRRQNIFALPVNPSGDKIMRMHGQTARIEAGGVFLPHRAPWLEEFRREILAFPHGRHDDQVDAFAQGLEKAFARQAPVAVIGRYVTRW